MQATRGELVNNLANLSDLDKEISDIQKLIEDDEERVDEELVTELRRQLRDELDVRRTRREVASENQRILHSQINIIKETINRMLEKDLKLSEKN